MEDWAEIRRLYRSENLSQAAIARRLSLSRNTVAKALHAEAPRAMSASSRRLRRGRRLCLAVRVLFGQFPTMPATVARPAGWRDPRAVLVR